MRKLIFSIFCLLFVINIVNAERIVNYNFKEGIIDNNGNFHATDIPVDNVDVFGYVCLDAGCKNLEASTLGFLQGEPKSSGDNSFIQLTYPTQLLSGFGYAVYYSKEGYIPWESNPNWFGTNPSDPQGSFNVYLSKKEACSSEITEFTIRNSERINTPVVVNVRADVDAKTKAAISKAGPLEAVPVELNEHYSVRTKISLDIIKDEISLFSDTKDVLIGFGEDSNVEFSFIPEQEGDYKALITTRITDEKCLNSNDQFIEKEFLILEENPLNTCYTELGDLELSSVNVEAGHDLLVKANKISNLQENIANEQIIPVSTLIKAALFNGFGEEVHEQNFVFVKNENSVDVNDVKFLVTIPDFLETGNYNLVLTGSANDERCSLDNKESTLSKNILVEETSNTQQPTITSEPVTKALLGEDYFYDVKAVDPNNDVLNFGLILAPEGMTIDSQTGEINWNVDEDKFDDGEKHFVFIIVDDGFFFDTQFFFVKIEEEKEDRKHDFRLSGLDLESSNAKEGIKGFLLLKNSGDFKENEVSVYADIYELNVHEIVTNNLNLGKEDSFWLPIDVSLPSNAKKGEYLMSIRIENNRHKEEQNFVVFVENNEGDEARLIVN